MTSLATVFLLVNAAALLLLPMRWAPLPLLVGACYMTLGEGIELGLFNFPVIRILVAVGLARVVLRGERLAGRFNALDGLMLAWALWALCASAFHRDMAATLVNRLGLVYNACGVYFLLRVFCGSVDDVLRLCRSVAILLIPLSLAMLWERLTGHNLFAALGGVDPISAVRGGRVRAQGPFAHAILAGSIGAACMPLMLAMWRRHRLTAMAGFTACFIMVWAAASSGPILSALLAVAALAMWPWRHWMRALRWLALLGYVALDIVMNAPAYFVLARMDMTGSSTAWHRAELIHAAIRHLSEWWLAGTDYTRHWMAYGVGWSANHIDITNYYIAMGVAGGLPLMLLFIAVLAKGFSFIGREVREQPDPASQFVMWALGAALFAHAATFVAVSYFDQSVVFLYVTLAAACAGHRRAEPVIEPDIDQAESAWQSSLIEGQATSHGP